MAWDPRRADPDDDRRPELASLHPTSGELIRRAVLLSTYGKAAELGWMMRHADAQVLLHPWEIYRWLRTPRSTSACARHPTRSSRSKATGLSRPA